MTCGNETMECFQSTMTPPASMEGGVPKWSPDLFLSASDLEVSLKSNSHCGACNHRPRIEGEQMTAGTEHAAQAASGVVMIRPGIRCL